jgi:hypothetical protein
VRDLVNLIQKTRQNKILQGLSMMQEAAAVKLNNLSAMELNSVRSFFTGALDEFHRQSIIGQRAVALPAQQQAAVAAAAGVGDEEPMPARQLRRGQ